MSHYRIDVDVAPTVRWFSFDDDHYDTAWSVPQSVCEPFSMDARWKGKHSNFTLHAMQATIPSTLQCQRRIVCWANVSPNREYCSHADEIDVVDAKWEHEKASDRISPFFFFHSFFLFVFIYSFVCKKEHIIEFWKSHKPFAHPHSRCAVLHHRHDMYESSMCVFFFVSLAVLLAAQSSRDEWCSNWHNKWHTLVLSFHSPRRLYK